MNFFCSNNHNLCHPRTRLSEVKSITFLTVLIIFYLKTFEARQTAFRSILR